MHIEKCKVDRNQIWNTGKSNVRNASMSCEIILNEKYGIIMGVIFSVYITQAYDQISSFCMKWTPCFFLSQISGEALSFRVEGL